jgi:hypothetical protein
MRRSSLLIDPERFIGIVKKIIRKCFKRIRDAWHVLIGKKFARSYNEKSKKKQAVVYQKDSLFNN